MCSNATKERRNYQQNKIWCSNATKEEITNRIRYYIIYNDVLYFVCTINICELSERSKFMLNQCIDIKKFSLIAVQETNTNDTKKLKLNNMICCSDSNNATNRGAASHVYVNMKFLTSPEVSSSSQLFDSARVVAEIRNKRVIVGSLYVN